MLNSAVAFSCGRRDNQNVLQYAPLPFSRQFSHILRFTGLVSPATVWWIIYECHTAAEKPQMNVVVFSETLWAHRQVINPLE